MTKHQIYVAKAALTEISIAVALWEIQPDKITLVGIIAVVVRALLQMCNASGAYRSDPNGATVGVEPVPPIIEPKKP